MNISWKKIIAPLTVFLLYLCNFCANLCTLAKSGHYTCHVKRENPAQMKWISILCTNLIFPLLHDDRLSWFFNIRFWANAIGLVPCWNICRLFTWVFMIFSFIILGTIPCGRRWIVSARVTVLTDTPIRGLCFCPCIRQCVCLWTGLTPWSSLRPFSLREDGTEWL